MDRKRFGAAGLVFLPVAGGSAVAQSGAPLADAAANMDRVKIAALLKRGGRVPCIRGSFAVLGERADRITHRE